MKYIFTVLFFALTFQSQAQRNFKPGYIVALNGDTTKGFVDYRDWTQNPQSITFSTSLQGTGKEHTASEVLAFGVNGAEHYRAYTGPISNGSTQTSRLTYAIDSSTTVKSVFLRLLINGKNAALLNYDDEIKNRFFITDNQAGTSELKYFRYISEKEAGKIESANTYRIQLQRLVSNTVQATRF